MNPIENQRQLIDQLYHLVKKSLKANYDSSSCRIEYLREADGTWAVDIARCHIQKTAK